MKLSKFIPAFLPFLLLVFFAQGQTLQEAIKYSQSERYDLADGIFKKLLVSEPANGDVYYYYAKNYMFIEDLDSAEVVLRKGIEKAPSAALNYVGLAAIDMHRGKKGEAKTNIDKALSLDNKTLPVYIEGAYALINAPTKDTTQAMDLLEKARDLDMGKDKKPKYAPLYVAIGDVFLESNNGGKAMNNYELALTIDKTLVNAHLRIGQLWVRARNFASALDAYNNAIKIDAQFAPAYREKGDFYFMFNKIGLALEDYKKYLELSKNNFKARVRYVKFLFLAKQYNDVITEGEQILKTDPNQTIIRRLLAYSYYETRKYPEALKAITDFLAKQPVEKILPSDHEYHGKILIKSGQDSVGVLKLVEIYEKDTSRKEISGDIGGAYLKLKKYDEAIKYLKIKTAQPTGVMTLDYLNLGSAYFQTKKWAAADSAFGAANVLQPDYSKGYLLRARSQTKLDSLETKTYSAKPYYDLYIKKTKADEVAANKATLSEAYKYLGSYYFFSQKNFPYALFAFNKALEFAPDDKLVSEFLKKKEFENVTPQCWDCFVVTSSAPDFSITYQFEKGANQNMEVKGNSQIVLMSGATGNSYNVTAKGKTLPDTIEIKIYRDGKLINEGKSADGTNTVAVSGFLP